MASTPGIEKSKFNQFLTESKKRDRSPDSLERETSADAKRERADSGADDSDEEDRYKEVDKLEPPLDIVDLCGGRKISKEAWKNFLPLVHKNICKEKNVANRIAFIQSGSKELTIAIVEIISNYIFNERIHTVERLEKIRKTVNSSAKNLENLLEPVLSEEIASLTSARYKDLSEEENVLIIYQQRLVKLIDVLSFICKDGGLDTRQPPLSGASRRSTK